MACLQPTDVRPKRKSVDGNTTIDGLGTIQVPCGKCASCKKARIRSWAFRLLQEDKIHSNVVFATLTYDQRFIRRTKNGFKTLCKSDVQSFFKRLRYNTGKVIKYYAVGEYGSKTQRPHYHAIIFGATWDDVEMAWRDIKSKANPNGTDEPMGNVMAPSIINNATVAYTAKYIAKPSTVGKHKRDDRVKEFSLMSKNLGLNYLTPQMETYHLTTDANYVTLPDGITQALPRYYREKIFTKEDQERFAQQSQYKFKTIEENGIKKYGNVTDYRLAMREAAKQQNNSFLNANKRDQI